MFYVKELVGLIQVRRRSFCTSRDRMKTDTKVLAMFKDLRVGDMVLLDGKVGGRHLILSSLGSSF